MNETQAELRSSLETTRKLDQKFSGLEKRVNTEQRQLRLKLDTVEGRVTNLLTKLKKLDERVKDIEDDIWEPDSSRSGGGREPIERIRNIRRERLSNTLPSPPSTSLAIPRSDSSRRETSYETGHGTSYEASNGLPQFTDPRPQTSHGPYGPYGPYQYVQHGPYCPHHFGPFGVFPPWR